MRPRAPRRSAPWLLAAAAYTTLAIVLTWPLAVRLSAVLPHDLGDPILNTWILWRNAHVMPLTARWWNAPIFWPVEGAFALSEHLVGVSLVASPLQWLGASPVTAYNVVFLMSFPLSALAAHALGQTLTGRHDAAAVAGLAYGFNPYRIAQAPHLQMLTVFGMPAALFALHKYLQQRDRRWLWLFGAAWLQQALSNGYCLMFFPVLLVLWFTWFAVRADRRASTAIAVTFVLASLPLLPFLWTYREIHSGLNLQRGFGEIGAFGADAAGLVDASPLVALWGRVHIFHRPEGELYPGLTIAVLVATVVASSLRRFPRTNRTPRWSAALLALSVACTAIALSALATGPWSITVAGVKLLSVGVVSKPLSLGLLFFVLAVAVDPRVVRAGSAGSPLMFYVAATAAMYFLSFGPVPTFLGAPFAYRPPYAWLMMVPGFDSLRVPARFAMVALVCFSAAAAMAFARLTAPLDRAARTIAAAGVIGAVLAESWITGMPMRDLPPRFRTLETLPAGAAVVELPLGDIERDTAAMFRSIYHGHPVVNGYSGYAPAQYDILHLALEDGDTSVLDVLALSAPLVIAVEESHDRAERWLKPLREWPGAATLTVESGRRIFSVPQSRPVDTVADDPPLRIQSISANVYPMDAAKMIDGDPQSRWETRRAQAGTETVTLDLGGVHLVSRVKLSLGPFVADYPRLLAIDSSEDGKPWTERWRGRTAALAIAGAMHNPREVTLDLSLPASRARSVRLREVAVDSMYHWSISEVAVLGR